MFWRPDNLIVTEDVRVGFWPITFVAGERIVLHGVIDSNAANVGDRARLYRNGMLMSGNTGTAIEPGETLRLDDNHSFVLGNREVGLRSFEGTLFYAAIYASALTSAEVANNAAVLLASDDKPE